MSQKRVKFDFVVEFSNGGDLRGRDFRLDIDGDDIADEALSDYLVRDLRLLMAGPVHIANKSIIEEPHRRNGASVQLPSADRTHDVRRAGDDVPDPGTCRCCGASMQADARP